MSFFCTQTFKDQYEKIISKHRHYRDFTKDLIKYLFEKKTENSDGTLLHFFGDNIYMKKRINGAGGYRVYYFVYIANNDTVLLYAHPKTGPLGVPSIPKKQRRELPVNMFQSFKEMDYYKVMVSKDKTSLIFKKV